MSEHTPTITLEIGNLKDSAYPLRLLFHGENGLEEKAAASIPKTEFEPGNWNFDPIEKFLNDPDASNDFREIGGKLYSLLYRDKVAAEWKKFADANTERCRIQLDVKPSEVAAFPWELVRRDNKDWLALSKAQTFVRQYQPQNAIVPAAENLMLLRVLIVIGTKNDDAAVLPWQEVRLIESAIHNFKRDAAENQLAHRIIDIEVLAQPDLERLQKKYQEIKPHIFHFIGHGGLNDDGDAYLLLKYPDKTQPDKFEETEWTYDFISTTFRNFESVPRFVFINACRSENKRLSEEEIKTQAWSIGDVFRDLKVPAVLTMQADIGSESAGIFSGAIYESLARLEPLDAALAHAREAMLNNLATTKKRDWAIPVLTVAAPSEEILPFKPKASKELMAKIKSCEAFAGIECFIDRTEPRRQLIQGFYPLPPGVPDKHLTIVKGEENSGKTWLAKWCLEVCALLNHDVRYVEVGGERTTTWLDVLLRIRGGDKINRGSLLIHQELDKTAFEQFYWELQHRFQMSEPPPRNNSPVVPKDDYQLAGSTWTPKFYTDTIESFLQALAQTAHADNPLIIVLNRFKGISESDMKNELIPKLFEPVAAGQVRSVKFVLVLTEDEYRNFDVANLVSRSNKVSVNLLKPDTFFDVASEYLRKLNRLQNLGFLEEEIADLAKNTARLFVKKNQDYSPSELERRFG